MSATVTTEAHPISAGSMADLISASSMTGGSISAGSMTGVIISAGSMADPISAGSMIGAEAR